LIDASGICHSLRKSLGNKRNEITPEDRKRITELYANFEENELCQIYDNEEFMYREYVVKQPLQRSYAIDDERIENLVASGALNSVYDEAKVNELENSEEELSAKDEKTLEKLKAGKPIYDSIFETLKANKSKKKYMEPKSFTAVIEELFPNLDKKLQGKIVDGLSVMDKEAEIQKDKKGNVLWDNDTKDIEIVKYSEKIEDYMAREVLPHIPDAEAFFEENLGAKKPVVKTGAEIPFTRYFYKYQQPKASKDLAKEFVELDKSVNKRIAKLFG
jgi:type I restriction enzyme M protein